jgi:hypothetical protein
MIPSVPPGTDKPMKLSMRRPLVLSNSFEYFSRNLSMSAFLVGAVLMSSTKSP